MALYRVIPPDGQTGFAAKQHCTQAITGVSNEARSPCLPVMTWQPALFESPELLRNGTDG